MTAIKFEERDSPPLTFGEWLFAERTKRGWSQDVLADKVHFSKSYISGLENELSNSKYGHKPKPRLETITRFANVFGIDPNIPQMLVYPPNGYQPGDTLIIQSDELLKTLGIRDKPDALRTIAQLREEAQRFQASAQTLENAAQELERRVA